MTDPHSFLGFIKQHKGLIVGVGLGLLIGILILTIGFFATLFLAVCAGIGAFLGSSNKYRNKILKILDKILPDIFK